MKLSVVIPVYNEEENIAPIYEELRAAFKHSGILLEIIFINDASTDQTLKQIKALALLDSRLVLINLSQNHGQSYATMQGIQAATGELIAFLDGDLQNDASELPNMVTHLLTGYDLVCGWRKQRKDKKIFVVSSRVANFIIRTMFCIKTHDTGCSIRVAYTRHLKSIKYFEHFHRYIPVILTMKKLHVTELVVNHRIRNTGQSKYSILKSFGVIKELIFLRFFYRL